MLLAYRGVLTLPGAERQAQYFSNDLAKVQKWADDMLASYTATGKCINISIFKNAEVEIEKLSNRGEFKAKAVKEAKVLNDDATQTR